MPIRIAASVPMRLATQLEVLAQTMKVETPKDGAGRSTAPPPSTMIPMVARDGLHYGASIEMPRAGRYTLTYRIDPPSAGGLGRHADPATGVAPWWEPFEVSFDWDYPGPPQTQ